MMRDKNLGTGFGGGHKKEGKSSSGNNPTSRSLQMDLAYLEVIKGKVPGTSISLNKVRLVLGRDPANTTEVDIDLTGQELGNVPVVSRFHAEFSWEDGRLLLRDIGSKHGTFVNDQPIYALKDEKPCQPIEIKLGDSIGLANLTFEVRQS